MKFKDVSGVSDAQKTLFTKDQTVGETVLGMYTNVKYIAKHYSTHMQGTLYIYNKYGTVISAISKINIQLRYFAKARNVILG